MIVTLNALSSITMVSGNWSIQLALFFLACYVWIYYTPYLNQELTATYYTAYYTVVLAATFHFIACMADGVNTLIGHQHSAAQKLLSIGIFLLEIFTYGRVGYCMYLLRAIDSDNVYIPRMIYYLLIELSGFPCFCFANATFLLFRSQLKHKMLAEQEIPIYYRVPNVDTMIAL